MKYDKEWLLKEIEDQNQEFLLFWGHQKSKDNSSTKTCLSQWWEADFIEDGIKYPSAEHYMMAQKAKLFEDDEIFQKILTIKSPKAIKDLGRLIKNFHPKIWDAKKFDIVRQGNLLKFSQNEHLKLFLLQTQRKVLVEASPLDFIWGIGLAVEHIDARNPKKWKGQNLLGFALMEVRDQLIH